MENLHYNQLKLQNQTCFPLYAAAREVIKQYHPFLEPLGLTYTQYIAMMVLWEKHQLSAKELGQTLFLDSGTLTPVLKALEQKGFVTRSRCPEDERLLIVSITEKGMQLQEPASMVPAKIGECINLHAEEAAVLYPLLYKILGVTVSLKQTVSVGKDV
ncbi:MAG: MarR family transcriptional regulator [Lachnospiraceae bacterium]|nr:MarR family transcriptional regulator [Lachnospiraceae bacterium]